MTDHDILRYAECNRCVLDGTDDICCAVCKPILACHLLAKEIPVIRSFAVEPKRCEWFSSKEEEIRGAKQMNEQKQILDLKIALCQMIMQFMHTSVSEDGVEYFDNYCESAGEAAFSILGLTEDRVPKRAFYHLFDHLLQERGRCSNGEYYRLPYSWEARYLADFAQHQAQILEKQRQIAMCRGCRYDDCGACERDDKIHCVCPCDSCREVDGHMTNYIAQKC